MTESLIVTAQDQALNASYHQKDILKQAVDSRCRMYNQTEEAVLNKYYKHRAQKVVNLGETVIMWDVSIITDRIISANLHDIKV